MFEFLKQLFQEIKPLITELRKDMVMGAAVRSEIHSSVTGILAERFNIDDRHLGCKVTIQGNEIRKWCPNVSIKDQHIAMYIGECIEVTMHDIWSKYVQGVPAWWFFDIVSIWPRPAMAPSRIFIPFKRNIVYGIDYEEYPHTVHNLSDLKPHTPFRTLLPPSRLPGEPKIERKSTIWLKGQNARSQCGTT